MLPGHEVVEGVDPVKFAEVDQAQVDGGVVVVPELGLGGDLDQGVVRGA